ncbi:MAG: XRE family transcriptional regulator [Thermomicrobiales bacterium]
MKRASADIRAAELDLEMDLTEMRRARRLSREDLAQALHIDQSAVARPEKRADGCVSTLRRFVEAMDGDLEIVARFPAHAVTIRHFSDPAGKEAS